MLPPISITAISSISSLGQSAETIWQRYRDGIPFFSEFDATKVSGVTTEIEKEIALLSEQPAYKKLDRTALLAILTARKIAKDHSLAHKNIGVNIGSSRGATALFEKYHTDFQQQHQLSPHASPTTTLGNISSWVAQDLKTTGVQIDHSVTCSTAMHALLNGIAWLRADMADAFLVGGSEAALTSFTLAQMRALKLYSQSQHRLACESMRFQKKTNTMVLGEGAAIALLERGRTENTKAVIAGYGFASELLEHSSSISEEAECFQQSMRKALENAHLDTVDVVIMHAPGTVKGDLAEKNAIDCVFGKQLPLLTSNKWLVGHTFAASGMLSVQMAILMLQKNKFIENPFFGNARHLPEQLTSVMVNAVGFGGNAVSIILKKPETN